ncbi:hypothetical protein EOD39_11949 [Acipenser ruthenus]|uniref:Uncharacterized protein n=1 Tax=Acipenser ruthenus TaxID=7906 RepID=A0A662YSS1_ACIRT|nr:hypothetical protein EOD39_11949 [Acipenser ruthenus]
MSPTPPSNLERRSQETWERTQTDFQGQGVQVLASSPKLASSGARAASASGMDLLCAQANNLQTFSLPTIAVSLPLFLSFHVASPQADPPDRSAK